MEAAAARSVTTDSMGSPLAAYGLDDEVPEPEGGKVKRQPPLMPWEKRT